MITFFVPGIPAPGGSKKGFIRGGRVAIVEDCKRSGPWKERVAIVAAEAFRDHPILTCAVSIEMVFRMPRPRGHYGSGKNAERLKPSAPYYHISKPDATKLLRSTEDALKGILWRDDSQIVEQSVRKIYAPAANPTPGVEITVRVYHPREDAC